jgi:hypothetical protein
MTQNRSLLDLSEMSTTAEPLWRKPSQETRRKLLDSFFEIDLAKTDSAIFKSYFQYYARALAMLNYRTLASTSTDSQLLIQNHIELIGIVEAIRSNGAEKGEFCRNLAAQYSGDESGASRTVDLVLRLWLMINVREPEAALQAPQTPIRRWQPAQTLPKFLSLVFETSRWKVEAKDSRLHPSFTAAFMVNVCGLRLEWTDCLADHLKLDRRVNALRVYSYKNILQAHLKMSNTRSGGMTDSPLPERLLQETVRSLNLLFPPWDADTASLLSGQRQNFQQTGPYDVPPISNLIEFQYWRDRLSELHDVVFLSPPVSWAQLWRDRRNPQQFWTFWLAFLILLFTLISTITSIVQAWATVRALKSR